MRIIPTSELIVNQDGTIFHLHLLPENISDKIILVGDPARVEMVASRFDSIEFKGGNREFVTITGSYKSQRITVISTGIGTDNVDIVINELDALVNVDLGTRTEKSEHKSLTLVRLGTTGGLQPELSIGSYVLARTSVGFDGLLNFYANRDKVSNLDMEKAFVEHTGWNPQLASPYFVDSSKELAELFADFTVEGITIAAPGFYAPQGRYLRLSPADPQLNEKIESFEYQGRKITNFEMESSALAGLSLLLGHKATTICTVIAQRVAKDMNTDYKPFVEKLVDKVLEKLTTI
ncbi:MAG: nucleoside phosphorylase [Rikenellaceae bacterium]